MTAGRELGLSGCSSLLEDTSLLPGRGPKWGPLVLSWGRIQCPLLIEVTPKGHHADPEWPLSSW